jgi:hypothetical protein
MQLLLNAGAAPSHRLIILDETTFPNLSGEALEIKCVFISSGIKSRQKIVP